MEKLFTVPLFAACISATTVDESTQPESNAPSGTSAIMRRLAAPWQRQHRTGLELVNAFIDRARRGDVIVPHEGGDSAVVDLRRPARMRAQRLELRAEHESVTEL